MSDPKRATLITVGAPKSAKNNVNKTLRLSINLDVSDEIKYPELNYKELYAAALKRKGGENCKTSGADPFSDNDDDIKKTRKFEQKYGGKSTYGKKGRSKYDDLADIGAGYDVNDPFIDNSDRYDEIMPPERDTEYGGFYINSGKLELKTVPDRCQSSSSSEEESSASSSDSDSQEAKDAKPITNGNVDSHKTEHRKKKNKTIDKQKAKKIRRTDSSAATSGKQTSDENAPADGSSGDSRTSGSDSLTSKPAPSSDNNASSDSSRDGESKVEIKLPDSVNQILEELEVLSRLKENLGKDDSKTDACIVRLDKALKEVAEGSLCEHAWSRAAKMLGIERAVITHRAREKERLNNVPVQNSQPHPTAGTKRKLDEVLDTSSMTPEEREASIEDILQRLKALIKEREPGMMATYKAECERVDEERKKLSIGSAGNATGSERRRPKRRFPWCARVRGLLARLAALGGAPEHPAAAAALLTQRAFPLFPDGFVRLPTLLKQADLNKDIKVSELKKQRVSSISSHPVIQTAQPVQPLSSQTLLRTQTVQPAQTVQPMITNQFTEPIQFPSSLTVTTSVKNIEKTEDDKFKISPAIGALRNSYSLNKDLVIEKPEDRKTERKEEYIPANSIGSITITPVSSKDKKDKAKEPLLRVKSPAALNDMLNKKDKPKKPEKSMSIVRDKRVESPLHIDTGLTTKDTPSPKLKEEISQKVIENMRSVENNIPRPALISVHDSLTFAKPDKRPPEVKKKNELLIVSDLDPLSDVQEPLAVDDSSSDVEVVEDKDRCQNSDVPSDVKSDKCEDVSDETTKEVMRNLREMAHSQEPTNLNCNSYGGVITSERDSLKKLDGSTVTG